MSALPEYFVVVATPLRSYFRITQSFKGNRNKFYYRGNTPHVDAIITQSLPIDANLLYLHLLKGKTLIVVLGWMGALPKHVQKYVDWWHEQECDHMVYYSSVASTFFPLKARNDAQGIVDKMEEYRIAHPDTPIVFHVFSNGGGFVYSRIMKIINTEKYDKLHKNVKCAVLDSLLSLSFISAGRAFSELGFPFFVNLLFYLLVMPYLIVVLGMSGWVSRQIANFTLSKEIPYLVLYSKADTICPHTEIDLFVSKLRQKNVLVTTHKWNDSPHVSHFRLHRDEYEALVTNFVASNGVSVSREICK